MTPNEITALLQSWIAPGAVCMPTGGSSHLIGLFRAEPRRFAFMEAFAEDQHHVHVLEYQDAQLADRDDVPEIRLLGDGGVVAVITRIESDLTGTDYPQLRQAAVAWHETLSDEAITERYERFFVLNS